MLPQLVKKKTKKRSERRKHCTLAVVRRVEKVCPAADPLAGGARRPKFNQLKMITTFTYRPVPKITKNSHCILLWRARGTRAYNGGLGAEPPAGSRGRAPGQGVRSEAP